MGGRSRSHSRSHHHRHRSRSRRGEKRGHSRDAESRHQPQHRTETTAATATAATGGLSETAENIVHQKPADLDEKCCLRIGVLNLGSSLLTKEQVADEIDSIHMAHHVIHIILEDPTEQTSKPKYASTCSWARVYFASPDEADTAAVEMNVPLRASKWKSFVTQRLPLAGAYTGDVGGDPAFEPCLEDPPEGVVVDTQEGWCYFNTDELFRTKGLDDFFQAKHQGKVIRRLVCKHFDPQKRQPCRFGVQCMFVHIKASSMTRLLRTVSHRQPLRIPKNEEDIQVSSWEFDRRQDTLLIRDLDKDIEINGLRYMFEACGGFTDCALMKNRGDEKPYGLVRFDSPFNAFAALAQTYNSGLNVSRCGALEDCRMIQLHEAKRNPGATRRGPRSSNVGGRGDDSHRPVPFPPLPPGWIHGVSRRTNQFYFSRIDGAERTTWKHPLTGAGYSAA